jgi:hypothetical protein
VRSSALGARRSHASMYPCTDYIICSLTVVLTSTCSLRQMPSSQTYCVQFSRQSSGGAALSSALPTRVIDLGSPFSGNVLRKKRYLASSDMYEAYCVSSRYARGCLVCNCKFHSDPRRIRSCLDRYEFCFLRFDCVRAIFSSFLQSMWDHDPYTPCHI